MAKNKKSFILYTDLKSVVEKLIIKDREDGTNNSGELFYHILEYVNDEDPEPINFIIEMAFEPIRLQLKRDLIKWEGICERNRVNGSKGGRPKKKPSNNPKNPVGYLGTQNNPEEPKKPDNDNDNDNDIKEKVNKKEVEFKKSIQPFIERYGKDICNNFYLYWTEPNKSKTKLRYEMEKTWDVKRRLANWANRDKTFNAKSNKPIAEPNYQKL